MANPEQLFRETFQYLDSALERPKFALRQLGQAVFEAPVCGRRLFEELLASLRQAKGQPAPVVRVGAAIDLSRPDQDVDGAAHRRLPAPDLGGDLPKRGRRIHPHGFQKVALLTNCPRRNGVAAELFDQASEAFRET